MHAPSLRERFLVMQQFRKEIMESVALAKGHAGCARRKPADRRHFTKSPLYALKRRARSTFYKVIHESYDQATPPTRDLESPPKSHDIEPWTCVRFSSSTAAVQREILRTLHKFGQG